MSRNGSLLSPNQRHVELDDGDGVFIKRQPETSTAANDMVILGNGVLEGRLTVASLSSNSALCHCRPDK